MIMYPLLIIFGEGFTAVRTPEDDFQIPFVYMKSYDAKGISLPREFDRSVLLSLYVFFLMIRLRLLNHIPFR